MEEEVKYLDWEGLQLYHSKIEEELTKKANAADLADVATSGDYEDLINLPTKVSAFDNDAGYLTSEIDNTNGHAFIEIGGLKWATMNIGAEDITDVGLYFQWGDIEGFASDQVGVDKQFTWNDYKFNPSGDGSTFTKYNAIDEKTVLDLEDDPVAHAWGSDWRTPTYAEFQAFYAAVDTEWTNDYEDSGIAGLICTDKEDESKVIFFPAAGLCNQGSVISDNTEGFYWSKTLSNTVSSGIGIGFDNSATDWNLAQSRCYGFCLRGILNGPAKRLVTGVTQAEKDIWNSKVSTQELEEAIEDVELSAGKGIVIENNTVSIDDTVEVVITLNSAPTSSTLTYTKNSTQYNFKVGDEVRVPDLNVPTGNHGYIYYKLFDLVTIEQTTTAFWCAIGAGSSEGGSFYTPTLTQAPTESTLTYTKDGQTIAFEIGQFCRVADADAPLGYEFYQLYDLALNGTVAKWNACPTKMNPTYTPPTPSLTPPVYTGSPQPILEGGSSGDGNIQYSMDGSNWSSTIPTVTDAGTYTVYWRLQGDGMHSDVPPTAITVTMLPKEVEDPDITLSISEYTYDGNACTPTVTLKDGDTTIDSSEYIVTYSDNTNAGTATITITNVANGNYVINASTTFTIDKVTPTVTAPTAKTLTYTGSALTLINAGSTDWGTLQYSLDNINYSTNIPDGTNADTYTVYYKVVGNSNINDVAALTVSVTIDKAAPTYTAPTAKSGLVYSGSALDLLNAGSTNHGTIQYSADGSTWSTSIPQGTNADDYTPQWKLVGDSNHSDVAATTINVSIAKVTPTVVAPTAKTLTYSGSALELLNAGSTNFGTIQYSEDETNWSTTIPSKTNAGSYTIYYRVLGDSNINTTSSASVSTSIAKATPTYTAPTAKSVTYNGSAQEVLNAGSSNNGTISYSEDEETWSSTIPSKTNAGDYTVYWKLTGDSNHSDIASTSVNVSISKVTPTVTAPTAKSELTYNSTAQDLVTAGSTNYGELQYSLDDVNYSTSVATGTNAGSYTVYYKVVGNSNVNDVAATSISVSIAKGTPTVTAPTAKTGLTYNGLAQELVNAGVSDFGTIKYSLGVQQQVVNNNGHAYVDLGLPSGALWATMNVGANAPEDYGNYYMYGKGATVYNSSDSQYTGTEDPLSLSVDTARQVWNGDWHMPTKTQLLELKANTTYEWVTLNGVNGGLFTSTINGNSIFIPAAGYWGYGSYVQEGSYGCIWSSSLSASDISYCIIFRDINVWVNDEDGMRYFGYSVRGVIDSASTIIIPSTYSTSIPTGTNIGTYYVYWKIEGDDNINEVSGSTAIEVTIGKGIRTLSFGDSSAKNVGRKFNPQATPSAGGGTVSYSSANTSIATVEGNYIIGQKEGSVTITATIAEDANYQAASASYTLTLTYPLGVFAAMNNGELLTEDEVDEADAANLFGYGIVTTNCRFIANYRSGVSDDGGQSYLSTTPCSWLIGSGYNNYITAPNYQGDPLQDYNGEQHTRDFLNIATSVGDTHPIRSYQTTFSDNKGYCPSLGETYELYNNKAQIISLASKLNKLTDIWSSTYGFWTTSLDSYTSNKGLFRVINNSDGSVRKNLSGGNNAFLLVCHQL